MELSSVDIAAANSAAITSPVSPAGSSLAMNRGRIWSVLSVTSNSAGWVL